MDLAAKRAVFGDLKFLVCENVYEPAEDSFLFAENLHVAADARVLEVGTGTGILAILAAKQAREVVAIDISPFAIHCAKENAEHNNLQGNMSFLQGDLFAPLNETAKFDLILFNAPYLPSEEGEEESWLARAWAGGPTGRQVIDRFITQAPKHLEKQGEILLMQSSFANVDGTVEKFRAFGLGTEVVATLKLPFFETLSLIRASLTGA